MSFPLADVGYTEAVWVMVVKSLIIFLGGLQAIPRDVYEAATIDGASRFQQFLAVTVPMLLPSMIG